MAFLKEALGIAFMAGVLSAGVTALVPFKSSERAQDAVATASGTRDAALAKPMEMTQTLRDRLHAPLSAAYGSLPTGITPLVEGAPHAVFGPQASPAPTVAAAPTLVAKAAPTGPAEAKPVPSPEAGPARTDADGRWASTPHPELIAKAEAHFDNGDIAGARSWLEVADEQGDAEGTYRLAETYDPAVLRELKAIGIASDVAKARALYERALNGGVESALQRLGKLPR